MEKLKIIPWTVNSKVGSCEILYHKKKSSFLSIQCCFPPCGEGHVSFSEITCKISKAWTFDLINFKLLTLTNQSDLSIKNMIQLFSLILLSGLSFFCIPLKLKLVLKVYFGSILRTFLCYLEILVYLFFLRIFRLYWISS